MSDEHEKKEPTLLQRCAGEPETDIGNGRRFIHRYGEDVFHIAKIGWHGFDGLRWREDDDGSVVRPLAQRAAEAIRFECSEIVLDAAETAVVEAGNDAEIEIDRLGKEADGARLRELKRMVHDRDALDDALEKRVARRGTHAKSSAGTSKIDNMLTEAAPHLKRRLDQMNAGALALNCRNGTLRFVRVEDEESDPDDPRYRWFARLDPHRREDLITKLCEAEVATSVRENDGDGSATALPSELLDQDFFDQVAHERAPEFIRFIQRVQPEIAEREYLRRLLGYCLMGSTSEQMIGFWYGIGANGKSTLADVVGKIMNDLAVTLSIESFTGDAKRDGASATPDLVRLNGARLCFANEGDDGVRVKEGLVKSLTGGDKLPVRKMREEFIEIEVKAKFIVIGNHKPSIRGDDDGIWRRMQFLEWRIQIPVAERDKALPDKLWRERDGILAWMIAGALEFLSLGSLEPPPSVLAAVQEHREESDSIGAFLRAACEITGDNADETQGGDIFAAYGEWCRIEGAYAVHQATFFRRLPHLTRRTFKAPDGERMTQFAKSKSRYGSVYRGIRIKERWNVGARPIDGGGYGSK